MNAREHGRAVAERRPETARGLFPIDMAVGDYDRLRPLIDARVKPEGVALNVNTAWIGDFCDQPVYEVYDAAEFSLSWYVAARCRGEPVIALPVFPLRMPVLAYVFCRTDASFTSPRDLAGKRIGAPGYRYTVNLWLRGIFNEHYGLSPGQVTWVTGAPEGAGFVPPPGIRVELRPGSRPHEMLQRGEVDAIFVPSVPQAFIDGEPWIRRLFRDARSEMRSQVCRTGVMPITHTVVMKQSLYEREPWLAPSLTRAFMESQRVCDEHFRADPKHLGFSEAIFFFEEQRALYGHSAWGHGLTPANRRVVETFVRYAHEQGYIERRPPIEDLFAPNTLGL
ncbi:MAG: ABC transporter substrate-binding protein [Burkholderiales bacterium]|nr:ABC transporter substrate-binding protein [Burkholderiales bacterium]